MKTIFCILLIGLLVLVASGAAMADSYPTVDFQFDPDTFSYIYTVTVTPGDTYPLGYLELDTLVKNLAGPNAWSFSGPVAGGTDADWAAFSQEWALGKDAAVWFAQTADREIYPSSWVGVFTLVAPNTQPGQNIGLTMDGVEQSANRFVILVPGPSVIPEPSCLLVAAGGVMSLGGMLFRRRKS